MIYLVRQGQTDWNLFRRFNGVTETFLNQNGIEQAKKQAEELKDIEFDICFCSPQMRAVQTGEIIYKGKQQDVNALNVYAPLITLWIDKKEAYRVYDRFSESDIEILEDGNFLVRVAYPLDEWVYGLILSFGASAKVLEPLEIQQEIKKRISDMQNNYAKD